MSEKMNGGLGYRTCDTEERKQSIRGMFGF